MPPKKKGKGKKKKAKGPVNTNTFEDLVGKLKSYVRLELESKHVDKNPVVARFDSWLEEEATSKNGPANIIINFPIEPIFPKIITQALIDVKWTTCKALSFWNCEIGDIGTEHLSLQMPLLPSIFKLEILDSNVTPRGCQHLASFLSDGACPLTILRLDFNPLGSQGIEYLADGVERNLNLKILSLSYTQIDSTGAHALSRMLSNFDGKLAELNLEGNDLRNPGIMELAPSIGVCPNLKSLNIAQNKFGGELRVIDALAQSFSQNLTLSNINLDGNLIGDDGTKYFLEALADSKHIRAFEITPTVNPVSYAKVVEWIQSNKPAKKKKKKKGKKKSKKS